MKQFLISIFFVAIFPVAAAFAQTNSTDKIEPNQTQFLIESISQAITRIANSVESLNQRMKNFSETFSSNQGMRLSDRQQKLLVAFEYLNRAEQRLATLQNLKIDLTQKQATIKARLSKLEEQSRPEDIDRQIAPQGTTDAEELRTIRRQALYKEKNDLNSLNTDIQSTLNDTNAEIRQTESFLKNIRQRLFPEIQKDISDL